MAMSPYDSKILSYLKFFKVDPTKPIVENFPQVFNEETKKLWTLFTAKASVIAGKPQKSALFTILRFLDYCKSINVKPFINDPIDSKHIIRTLNTIYYNHIITDLKEALRKSSISIYFKCARRNPKTIRLNSKLHTVCYFVLEINNKRQSLDGALQELKNRLYYSVLPESLKNDVNKNNKSKLPRSNHLFNDYSNYYWFNFLISDFASISFRRTGDNKIVCRVIVRMNSDFPIKQQDCVNSTKLVKGLL